MIFISAKEKKKKKNSKAVLIKLSHYIDSFENEKSLKTDHEIEKKNR